MAPTVAQVERQEVPVSDLVVGLNCGGSDGWSAASRRTRRSGSRRISSSPRAARSVLAETPEVYGAEAPADPPRHVARGRRRRCSTGCRGGSRTRPPTADRWTTTRRPATRRAVSPRSSRSRSGRSPRAVTPPMVAVYRYAEPITDRGFSFMDTPGYDPVSVTGLIAGGCNLVVFTTGRGSALGYEAGPDPQARRPTPTPTAGCPTTWTSTAATSSSAASPSR